MLQLPDWGFLKFIIQTSAKAFFKSNLSRYFHCLNLSRKDSTSLTWLIGPWMIYPTMVSLASPTLLCLPFCAPATLNCFRCTNTSRFPVTALHCCFLCLLHSSPSLPLSKLNPVYFCISAPKLLPQKVFPDLLPTATSPQKYQIFYILSLYSESVIHSSFCSVQIYCYLCDCHPRKKK